MANALPLVTVTPLTLDLRTEIAAGLVVANVTKSDADGDAVSLSLDNTVLYQLIGSEIQLTEPGATYLETNGSLPAFTVTPSDPTESGAPVSVTPLIAPTYEISSTATGATNSKFFFEIQFDQAVTTLDLAALSVTGATLVAESFYAQSDNRYFSVEVIPDSASTTPAVLTLAAGAVTAIDSGVANLSGSFQQAVDTVLPVVESLTPEQASYAVGETVRYAVKFSEAVYVSDQVAEAKLPSIFILGYPKQPVYVSGSGSDTLIFETVQDYGALTAEQEFSPFNFTNFSQITDAAGNSPKSNSIPVTAVNTPVSLLPDTQVPEIISLSLVDDTLVLTANEALDSTNLPSADQFLVMADEERVAVTSVAIVGDKVSLTLERALTLGEQLSLSYTDDAALDGLAGVQDLSGNNLASFIQGRVADGYLANATVSAGDYTGLSDSSGYVFLPTGLADPIEVSGGTNIDTGVANTLTLKAPVGYRVINPITTLVQSLIESGSDVATAESVVQTQLGLGTVDLATYDPIAQDDVTTQLLAAKLATFVSLAIDGSGINSSQLFTEIATNLSQLASPFDSTTTSFKTLLSVDTQSALLNLTAAVTAEAKFASVSSMADITERQAIELDTVAPTITAATSYQLNEGNTAPVWLAQLQTSETLSVKYEIVAGVGDADLFTIDPLSGDLSFTGLADYESGKTGYSVTVKLTDIAGNTSDTAISLNINNVDEAAPIIGMVDPTSVDENLSIGTWVYTVTATDLDDISSGVSFALDTTAGDDSAIFEIDPQTGQVTLLGSLDYESKSTYRFTVVATDGEGLSDRRQITLNINNLDESAPIITSTTVAVAIDENSGAEQVVYQTEVDDSGDIATALTYELDNVGDVNLFSIDPLTGAVTLVGNPNAELRSSYSFTVIVTDGAGFSADQTVTLAVNDIDEFEPQFTSAASAAVDEAVPVSTVVYTATVYDGDDISAGLTYSLVQGLGDDAAAFEIDPKTGEVRLLAEADYESKAAYTFTVQADDGVTTPAKRRVTLAINDIDEKIADPISPTVLSMALAGDALVLTFDESLDESNLPDISVFTLNINGAPVTPQALSVLDRELTLTLPAALTAGDQIEISYTDPTAEDDALAIQDIAGNDLASFIQGRVADGYLSGASVWIDSNNDGVADGDAIALTDAQGHYFLPDSYTSGALLITGGTNIDTGLVNEITLKAPVEYRVANPITTLIQNLIESGSEPVDAVADVSGAFGLTKFDLATYDPIARNDVQTQAIASQIATFVSIAAAGATASPDELMAEIATNLGDTTGPIDLSTTSLANYLESTLDSKVLALAQAAETAIQAATTLAQIAAVQEITAENLQSVLPANEIKVDADIAYSSTNAVDHFVITDGVTAEIVGFEAGDTLRFADDLTSGSSFNLIDSSPGDGTMVIAVGNTLITLSGLDSDQLSSYDLDGFKALFGADSLAFGPEQVVQTDTTAPQFTSGTGAESIDENSSIDTPVYQAAATDESAVTYALKGGVDDSDLFNIDANTGEVRLKVPANYEEHQSYAFTVVATDTSGNASEQVVSFDVNNLDEVAPVFSVASSEIRVDENIGAGYLIETVNVTDDADISDGISLTLTGDDAASFSIDSTTAELRLLDDPNYESQSSYSLNVIATDAAGNISEPHAVSVIINDLEELLAAPSITLSNIEEQVFVNVGDLVDGATWSYSTNAGSTWLAGSGSSFELAPGMYAENDVQVRQSLGGVTSDPALYTSAITVTAVYTPVDESLAVPILSISADAWYAIMDGDTSVYVDVAGAATADRWQYSLNGGADWFEGAGTSIFIPNGFYTPGAIQARFVSTSGAFGNEGKLNSALSVFVPEMGTNSGAVTNTALPLSFDLLSDTGVSDADGVTQNGIVKVSNLSEGSTWEYSLTRGFSWQSGSGDQFTLAQGTYNVGQLLVRERDADGNIIDTVSNTSPLTFDTQVQALQFSLVEDTFIDGDMITSNALIRVQGLEEGAYWQFSTDGGQSWSEGSGSFFTVPDGNYPQGMILARQIDIAGNIGAASSMASALIVDSTAPTALSLEAQANTNLINIVGLKAGMGWNYSLDGGLSWFEGVGSSIELDSGLYSAGQVRAVQYDAAGNYSPVTSNYQAIAAQNADNPTYIVETILNTEYVDVDGSGDYSNGDLFTDAARVISGLVVDDNGVADIVLAASGLSARTSGSTAYLGDNEILLLEGTYDKLAGEFQIDFLNGSDSMVLFDTDSSVNLSQSGFVVTNQLPAHLASTIYDDEVQFEIRS